MLVVEKNKTFAFRADVFITLGERTVAGEARRSERSERPQRPLGRFLKNYQALVLGLSQLVVGLNFHFFNSPA